MLRDFKKHAGMSVERWLESLEQVERSLIEAESTGTVTDTPPLEQLAAFYVHLADLAAGYEKDPKKLEEHEKIIEGWKMEVESLLSILT